jgi:leucyl/phenylalanyl-tRNA--protein transferase
MKRITWLAPGDPPARFPPVGEALDDPPGLLAAGGDLMPERLCEAYRRGIFPWYSPGEPVLWWSPDPREVLLPGEMHVSRSLRRTVRRGTYRVTENQAFAMVIAACATARGPAAGTWITPEMQAAYLELHARGVAHSIEVWWGDELAGGLYGVRSGRVFSGESMFSRRDDASKVALAWLAERCPERGIALIDCQMPSGHLRRLGSRPMPRRQFLELLEPQQVGR